MSDHGRFIWYELTVPNVARAKAFYGEVVGWSAGDMPGGGYSVWQADGVGVGGLMAPTDEMRAAGVPPNWLGYVAVDDADAAAARTVALGGKVERAPEDIPGIGRFAVISDPHGAVMAIMTPAPMDTPPPELPPDAQGQAGWRELYAGDLEADFAFYAGLFGWRKDSDMDMGDMGAYRLFSNQDGQVGGMMTRPPQVPVPYWLYYFRVGDIDAAADRVKTAGGQVLNGPMEVPGGDWIVQVQDPQGALFALVGRKGT
jgi:predicted enzyme related to lactoylglutathione lyase